MAKKKSNHLPSKKIIQDLRSRGLIVERGFIDGKRCWIVKDKTGGKQEFESIRDVFQHYWQDSKVKVDPDTQGSKEQQTLSDNATHNPPVEICSSDAG